MLLNQNRAIAVASQYKKDGKTSKQYAKYLNSINILPFTENIATIETITEHAKNEQIIKRRLLNAYNKTIAIDDTE
jgi:hypothetical protein